jgi:2-C-methyl-D-erythritol 4-phosphate cytidylyltransferase
LYEAFEKARQDAYYGTDEVSLVERLGTRVKIIPGAESNIKITRPEDLIIARALLSVLS